LYHNPLTASREAKLLPNELIGRESGSFGDYRPV